MVEGQIMQVYHMVRYVSGKSKMGDGRETVDITSVGSKNDDKLGCQKALSALNPNV